MANKAPYARRSSADPKWKHVKELVDKRDHHQCRFMRCLSVKESFQLIKGQEHTIDRAHIFAASASPTLIYNVNNVVTLTRFIHRRMDEYKSPLTGDAIDINEHYYWWHRIKNSLIEDFDPETDYELLLKQQIK
jgi:hypothetical protein